MIVIRWQAPNLPSKEQVKMIFQAEGLEPQEEIYQNSSRVERHKHPFDEVRMVISGQMFFNVSGNRLLLRSGDRIIIPANTKHETYLEGDGPCQSIYAERVF